MELSSAPLHQLFTRGRLFFPTKDPVAQPASLRRPPSEPKARATAPGYGGNASVVSWMRPFIEGLR